MWLPQYAMAGNRTTGEYQDNPVSLCRYAIIMLSLRRIQSPPKSGSNKGIHSTYFFLHPFLGSHSSMTNH